MPHDGYKDSDVSVIPPDTQVHFEQDPTLKALEPQLDNSSEIQRPTPEAAIEAMRALKSAWENDQPASIPTLEQSSRVLERFVNIPDDSTPAVITDLARAHLGRAMHDLAEARGHDDEAAIEARRTSILHLTTARIGMSSLLDVLNEYGFESLFQKDIIDLHADIVLGHIAMNDRDIIACSYALDRLRIQRKIDANHPEMIAKIDQEIAAEEQNMQNNLAWKKTSTAVARESKVLVQHREFDLWTEITRANYFADVYERELHEAVQPQRNIGQAALVQSTTDSSPRRVGEYAQAA